MGNKTAVEWVVSHWEKLQSEGEKMSWNQIIQITELAKEMEKEQIIDAHIEGQRVFDKYPHTQWTNDQAESYFTDTYQTEP